MFDHITKGTEITTEQGYLIIKGYNGHIVYANHYMQTWPDDAEEFTDDTATEVVEERMLTLSEIGLIMRAVDGRNHRVIYDNPNIVINEYGVEFERDVAVSYMDDELREYIHNEMETDTEQEFFNKYAELHYEKFGEEWELSKKNPQI